MRALLIPVGKMPREIDVEGLAGLQSAVGGRIAAVGWVFGDEPTLYVNDDGKFTCEPNRAVYATAEDAGAETWDGDAEKEGDVLDILFGDIVAVGFDPESGEDRDITEAEAAKVMARFGTERSIESGPLETLRVMLGTA